MLLQLLNHLGFKTRELTKFISLEISFIKFNAFFIYRLGFKKCWNYFLNFWILWSKLLFNDQHAFISSSRIKVLYETPPTLLVVYPGNSVKHVGGRQPQTFASDFTRFVCDYWDEFRSFFVISETCLWYRLQMLVKSEENLTIFHSTLVTENHKWVFVIASAVILFVFRFLNF